MSNKMSVSAEEYQQMKQLAVRQTELKVKALDAYQIYEQVRANHEQVLGALNGVLAELNRVGAELDAAYKTSVVDRYGIEGQCRIDENEIDGKHAVIVVESVIEPALANDLPND